MQVILRPLTVPAIDRVTKSRLTPLWFGICLWGGLVILFSFTGPLVNSEPWSVSLVHTCSFWLLWLFFLPGNRLAFFAVSAGAAQYLFAGWLPPGRLRIGGHRQSSGLSHLFAVAAPAPGHGASFTKFPAPRHFNWIPHGTGHRNLSADHE